MGVAKTAVNDQTSVCGDEKEVFRDIPLLAPSAK